MSPLRLLFVVVLLLSVVIRFKYAGEVARDPRAEYVELDALYHDYWARALITGDWTPPPGQPDPEIQTRPYIKAPGYPHFLAWIYRVVDGDRGAARAAQMIMGLVALLLLHRLALKLFDEAVATAAALLYGLCWLFPYYEAQFHETTSVILLSLGLWLLAFRAAETGRGALWFPTGVVVGILALFRPNYLLLVPVFAAGFAWVQVARPGGGGLRPAIRTAALVAVGAFVAIAPAAIRNVRASGESVLISAGSGLNLYLGNNPLADGHTGRAPDIATWSSFSHPDMVRRWSNEAGRTLNYTQASEMLKARAVAYIRDEPLRTMRLAWQKWLLLWGPLEVSVDQIDEVERETSATLRRLPVRFSLILAFALPGLLLWWRRDGRVGVADSMRVRFGLLLVAVTLLYAGSFLPFTVTGRYRVPMLPVLLLWASYAVVALVRRVRESDWRNVAVLAAGVGVCAMLVYPNWAGYRVEVERWPYSRGLAFAKQGALAEAEKEFRASIDLNPAFTPAWKSLALVLLEQGRYDEAEALLRRVCETDPKDASLWDMRGTVASRQGRWDVAAGHFAQGLALDGGNESLLLNAGTAAAASGRMDEAERYFRRVVAAHPRSAEGWYLLGRACREQGRVAEAAAAWQHALGLVRDANLRQEIAMMLTSMGAMPAGTTPDARP